MDATLGTLSLAPPAKVQEAENKSDDDTHGQDGADNHRHRNRTFSKKKGEKPSWSGVRLEVESLTRLGNGRNELA